MYVFFNVQKVADLQALAFFVIFFKVKIAFHDLGQAESWCWYWLCNTKRNGTLKANTRGNTCPPKSALCHIPSYLVKLIFFILGPGLRSSTPPTAIMGYNGALCLLAIATISVCPNFVFFFMDHVFTIS